MGVPVAIEPVNRFEGYAGFMNSVVEALAVVEAVGSDYLGIVADFFHLNIEDGPVTEALRTAGKHLRHIHLADSNRQMPGTGHLDFSDIVRVLHAIGYRGLPLDRLRPGQARLANSAHIHARVHEPDRNQRGLTAAPGERRLAPRAA